MSQLNDFLWCVVTTIQEPTQSIQLLHSCLKEVGANFIVVGDKKGPSTYDLAKVEFLSLQKQLTLDFKLVNSLPTGHYTRKNIGYLRAIAWGALCIYETDDDNAPNEAWAPRQEFCDSISVKGQKWVNVYRFFGAGKIWPRGFPLNEVQDSFDCSLSLSEDLVEREAPIQQGLANNSPDVDAIWRLILDEPFDFQPGPSVHLPRGTWCPFNSQSTWWFPAAYPLMYLPSYCSFRMTDIWRSFIAQRCLWEMGYGLVFHGPEVVQERNAHNLMRDFVDEIPGYTRNAEMVDLLERLSLGTGPAAVNSNLRICYEALVQAGFFPQKELELVEAWLSDLQAISSGQSR
ncbi:MAG: STELLO glycosyltransferase family protein [Blastocatellia bacterium]